MIRIMWKVIDQSSMLTQFCNSNIIVELWKLESWMGENPPDSNVTSLYQL